jgi:hypothetical protein
MTESSCSCNLLALMLDLFLPDDFIFDLTLSLKNRSLPVSTERKLPLYSNYEDLMRVRNHDFFYRLCPARFLTGIVAVTSPL